MIKSIERIKLHEKRKKLYRKAMKLRNNGVSYSTIANKLKVPLGTIKRWLCGINKPRNPKVTLQMLEKWKNLYKRKVATKFIANAYNLHPTTVLSYLRLMGMTKRKSAHKIPSKFVQEILEEKNLNFLNYFYWKPIRKKDIERFKAFLKCLRLYLKKEKLSAIDKKINLPNGTAHAFLTGRCFPKIVHFFMIYKKLGKPKDGHKWLNLNVKGAKLPQEPFIQVPMKIASWNDVKYVIDQLKPLNKAFERGEKFGFAQNEIIKNKYKFFAYFLGALVGDCSKHKSKKNCFENIHIELKLSKKHESNLRFGEFVSLCANSIGLKMDKVNSERNSCYCWRSQNSALNTYIFNTLLGLKAHETTTYTQLRMEWIFTAPSEFKKFFLQGIADSDGWVSIPKHEIGIESYPNSYLIKNLLESLGINSHLETKKGRKFVVIKGLKQLKRAFNLPIFNQLVKSYRYESLKKLANSNSFNPWPKWIHEKIKEYAKSYTASQISRKLLEEYNVSIRADRISEKLRVET